MKKTILILVAISMFPLCSAMAEGPSTQQAEKVKPLAQLIEDLGSENWQIQRDAAAALGERGPENLTSVLPLLKSDNARSRAGACEAIMSMTRRMSTRSKEETDKKLAAVRPAIGPMLEIIESDPDDWTRTVAAESMAGLSSQAHTVAGDDLLKVAVKILLDNNEDVWVRRNVYKIFNSRNLPKDNLDKNTLITIHLNASRFMDIMFRGGSMQALARMGADAAPAVPTMIEYAEAFHETGKDNRKGTYAIRALGAIGAPAKDGLPILRKLAKDGPQGVAAKYNKPGASDNIKREAAKAIELINADLEEAGKPSK